MTNPTPNTDTTNRGTVVITSTIHWDHTWQRHQQVASGFAKNGYQVYFVSPLPSRWWPGIDGLKQKIQKRVHVSPKTSGDVMRHPVPEGIEVIYPFGVPDKYWPAHQFNQRIAIRRLVNNLARKDLQKPLILYNFVPLPYALALQQILKPDVTVYDAVYDFTRVPGSENGAWIETEIALAADLVFADSPYHLSRMQALGANASEVLPAADITLFEQARSKFAPDKVKPLCAYFGTISATNQDMELLREVSYQYPLRLIGPADDEFEGFDPQTEWFGPVPYTKLPVLLKDVDVLLLPYSNQEHIEGVIPAKTFECLATGKPSIVLGLSSLNRYRDYFYLCSNHEEFLAAIEEASKENSDLANRRVALAQKNTWNQRIDQIIDRIDQHLVDQSIQQ